MEPLSSRQPEPVGEGEPRFGIGSPSWPGLAKVAEECGELLQVIGKIIAYPDRVDHPDGTADLRARLIEEMADVSATIQFAMEANYLSASDWLTRSEYKLERFRYWHHEIRMEQR